jgi:hypothetical protein
VVKTTTWVYLFFITGLQDPIKEGRISMKRKKVMRLLAVAMAASLAVTSQGIPVGLTTVEAAVTVTDASTSGLTKGHLYQEVTATPHAQHTKDCYTESSAKQVQSGDNFFKSADSTAYNGASVKVQDGSDYYVAAAQDAWVVQQEDVKVNSALTENQYIYKDISSATEKFFVYDATNITTDATIHSIEEKRLQGTSSYKSIVWIAANTDYSANSTYGDVSTTAGEGETNLKQSGSGAVTADGYYEITSWVKANSTDNSQADLPGAIKITDTSDESLKTLLKEESLTLNDVYVPLTIKSTAYDITAAGHYATAGTDKVTIDDTTYYAVKEDGSHKVTWATLAAASTAAYYTVKADGVYIQVVKDATLSDQVDHNTYSYTEVFLNSGSKDTKTTTLDSESIVKITTSNQGENTTKYYIDVTDKFVTKIEAKNKNVQPVVKSTTAETALDDTVIVTLGTGAKTEEVAAASVTNDYDSGKDYTGAGEDNVKITKIEGDTAYLYAEYDTSSAGQVIKDTEVSEKVKLISSVADLSTIASYVDVTGLSFKVKTVTPPDVTLSAATGNGKLADQISSADAFNATAGAVKVAAPTIEGLEDAANWTFKWKDVANSDTDHPTYSPAMAGNAALSDYTLTENDTLGKHEVSLVAYYNGTEVKEYTAVTFYVLKTVNLTVGTTYIKEGETSAQTVKLGTLLEQYKDDGNFSDADLEATEKDNKISDNKAEFKYSTGNATFTPSSVAEGNTVTFKGKISNTKYIVNVEIPVEVLASNATIKDLSGIQAAKVYYGDASTTIEALQTTISGSDSEHSANYTLTFGENKSTEIPKAVGTTVVYVSYTGDDGVGSGSTTVTINKKEIKITEKPQTIKQNGSISLDAANYTIAKNDEGDEVNTLPQGLTLTAKIFDEGGTDVTGTTLTVGGTYTYKYDITGSEAANYTLASSTGATLTVEAAPYTPASGTDKTDTDTSDTTEPTIKENEDGTKTIVDADGKVIANDKVTIDGKSYITDENGEVLTSQIAETPSGNKVYVGKDGAIVKNKTVTYDGKKYYATGSGKIATNKFVTTAKGNLVYATKSGALKVSKTFTVNGKKYYAKASGAIATTGFVKTAAGNTVYATKSGALKVNKVFKASDGKKYVASKSGTIVKGKKYTIGNKTYTTNKKGVIIKVTTKKK